jgi:benzoate/toluate 1,2-dioxygenase subunit beta
MNPQSIESFLYREALLMDEHRYQEWLSLWTGDGVYWVPCSPEATDPNREVSIIYDDRSKIADRVEYLESGTVRDAKSRPLLRRVISNIQIANIAEQTAEVESNFVLVEGRDGGQFIWAGRSLHRLRGREEDIKISFKKVLLVNCNQPVSVMQFLI